MVEHGQTVDRAESDQRRSGRWEWRVRCRPSSRRLASDPSGSTGASNRPRPCAGARSASSAISTACSPPPSAPAAAGRRASATKRWPREVLTPTRGPAPLDDDLARWWRAHRAVDDRNVKTRCTLSLRFLPASAQAALRALLSSLALEPEDATNLKLLARLAEEAPCDRESHVRGDYDRTQRT
jgi:hypothetical protein